MQSFQALANGSSSSFFSVNFNLLFHSYDGCPFFFLLLSGVFLHYYIYFKNFVFSIFILLYVFTNSVYTILGQSLCLFLHPPSFPVSCHTSSCSVGLWATLKRYDYLTTLGFLLLTLTSNGLFI